jgi:tetratricopeptide (TPR) repeat protein
LPLKGQILDNAPHKKTPIDYVVHNFNELAKRYSRDTIFDLISHLHRIGADLNEYSEDGTCPLINAHEANNDDLVNLLLELGADSNQYRQYKENKEEQERIERERHEEQERIEREQREEQKRKERERREEQERKERERREEQERKDRAERGLQRKIKEMEAKKENRKSLITTVTILLIIAVICGYFVNQCKIKDNRKADLYEQATIALAEGDYKTAINNFQSLGAYSDANMKLSQAAEIALSQGDYEAAINCCKSLKEALDLISQNDQSGGDYTIILKENQKISPVTLDYGGRQVTITLKASEDGKVRKVSFDEANAPLFTVTEGVTFVLEDRVVLNGDMLFSKTLVSVDGGSFIMNGGALSRCNGSSGVNIKSGTFTMNGGEITKNGEKKNGYGGGVHITGGTFTMNGGSINGNRARVGGGVYIRDKGVFTMAGGTISGNNGGFGGGVSLGGEGTFNMLGGTISGHDNFGVYVSYYINNKEIATFTKIGTGGVIYGSDAPKGQANAGAVHIVRVEKVGASAKYSNENNDVRINTANESTALDSRKRGAEGGWEDYSQAIRDASK